MTEPKIRAATSADADPLAAVYRSAYAENRELGFPAKAGSATAETVGEWIRTCQVHVATVGHDSGTETEVVGGVRLERTAPDRVKLSRLAVRDDWKGEGIGTRLLRHAERAARESDADVVWLTTPGDHPSLPAFYRSRGYERTGDYPLDYREYDEIVMEKSLD